VFNCHWCAVQTWISLTKFFLQDCSTASRSESPRSIKHSKTLLIFKRRVVIFSVTKSFDVIIKFLLAYFIIYNPNKYKSYTNMELVTCFWALSQICEKGLLVSSCLSVHLSVMEQLGSLLTGFYEIWYWRSIRKNIQKIQVSLKYDKNSGYCKWRPVHIFDNISLSSF